MGWAWRWSNECVGGMKEVKEMKEKKINIRGGERVEEMYVMGFYLYHRLSFRHLSFHVSCRTPQGHTPPQYCTACHDSAGHLPC